MKKIQIEIDANPRCIRFTLPNTKIFRNGGFELTYSFDARTSSRGLLSMGLGLLAPIISRHFRGDLEIVLPEPIPEEDAQAWRRYHSIPPRIHVSSTLNKADALPHVTPPAPNSPIGILYGGGKDSVAALVLAEKLYPSHPRELLRLHWNATSPERHQEAFERFALPALAQHTPFDYFSVSSTMHAELIDRTDAASVHLARYLCSFIPYIETRHPLFLCHGYDALEFHGSAYRRAHPQVLGYIDQIYRALNTPTKIRSLCFALPPKVSFSVISRLRPELVPAIYMCESLDTRWCYKCRKCFTYGILCLSHKIRTNDFSLDRMFDLGNPYLRRIARELEQPQNPALPDLIAYPAHFQAVSGWGPEIVLGARHFGLQESSASFLMNLFAKISEYARPHMDELWIQAACYEGGLDFGHSLHTLAKQYGIPISTLSGADGMVKGKPVRYLASDIE